MACSTRTRHSRPGMTLVELLMVITIMVILLAVSIPMVRPAFKDRKLREAARQINAFFAGAKARAAENGRPFGVWIQRADGTAFGSQRSVQLFYADVGPNFTGAAMGSRAWVGALGAGTPPVGQLHLSVLDAAILRTLVDRGEYFLIKFDHKGHRYSAVRNLVGAPQEFVVEIPTGVLPPGADSAPGLTFEITRGPVRSNVSPLRLPGDTVIDLSVSGLGTSGTQFSSAVAGNAPVVIMFTPAGDIYRLFAGGIGYPAQGTINLMIGRVAQVVDPTATNFSNPEIAKNANLTDPANLWVTIGHRSGNVITSDNTDTSWVPAAALLPERIRGARTLARSSVRKGGR